MYFPAKQIRLGQEVLGQDSHAKRGLVHTSSLVLLLDKALRTRGAAFEHLVYILAGGEGRIEMSILGIIVLKFECIVDVYFSRVLGLDCHCVFLTRLHSLRSTW